MFSTLCPGQLCVRASFQRSGTSKSPLSFTYYLQSRAEVSNWSPFHFFPGKYIGLNMQKAFYMPGTYKSFFKAPVAVLLPRSSFWIFDWTPVCPIWYHCLRQLWYYIWLFSTRLWVQVFSHGNSESGQTEKTSCECGFFQ